MSLTFDRIDLSEMDSNDLANLINRAVSLMTGYQNLHQTVYSHAKYAREHLAQADIDMENDHVKRAMSALDVAVEIYGPPVR